MTAAKRALLTWDDVAEAIEDLPPAQRDLAREIVAAERAVTDRGASTSEGTWYLVGAEVSGHVGIGQAPVSIAFAPANGLTVVTARNGTGKTSLVDGIRYAVSNGRARQFEIVDENLHHPQRSITVKLRSGTRDVAIVCDGDTIRWQEAGTEPEAIPREWAEAFERYLPILLHPELSPVMTRPGELHAFLKEALALDVLERLLAVAGQARREGTAAEQSVRGAWSRASQACAGHETLAAAVRRGRDGPSEEEAAELRALAAELPRDVRTRPVIAETWAVDDTVVAGVTADVAALDAARARVVGGADRVADSLARLLAASGDYLTDLRASDTCPVCRTSGAGWFGRARAEADRLSEMLRSVNAAKATAGGALVRLRGFLPPDLTEGGARTLRGTGEPGVEDRIARWRAVRARGERLLVDEATVGTVNAIARESADLAAWYRPVAETLHRGHLAEVTDHATVRAAVEQWLDAVEAARAVRSRAAAADALSEKVKQWIKDTRDVIFRPIGGEMVRIWESLNSDADLKLADVKLTGGAVRQQKVAFGLSVDGEAVPQGAGKAAILSTGQRNALSLAAYLPRATQESSPYGFLVLDDPIHAFDSWRVRCLARELIRLAGSHQVIVFTHDDRLWREVRALGHPARHLRLRRDGGRRSRVTVESASRPGDQLLRDLERVLEAESQEPLGDDAARVVMTLTICRQAVDTAVATQVEIVGRKLDKTEQVILRDLDGCRGTRDQVQLLNRYLVAAGLSTLDLRPNERIIDILNRGAHGRAPGSLGDCRAWLAQCRTFVSLLYGAV